nr:PhoD-like phosphatase N-terminal domain-containing protein [Pseudomonadota bacterium]
MTTTLLHRRQIIAAALAIGAVPVFAAAPRGSASGWREASARFPQGVASGDPRPDSVILWTRREPRGGETAARVTLEVAE